jgi:AmpE protein
MIMALLSIVFVFLLARYTAAARYLHRDTVVSALLDALAARSKPNSWVAFFVMPVGGALSLLLVWWWLDFWLSFFFGVLLLLWSVGRGDWHRGMRDLAIQLKDGNAESVLLHFEECGLVTNDNSEPDQAIWLAWRRYAGSWYLDRLFSVFFWFFVLGPVGAVFYRGLVLYNQHVQTRSGHLPSAKKIQHILDWLPVRFMGLCSCLAGNFTTGFRVWQKQVMNMQVSSADFLAHCLDASLVLDGDGITVPANTEYSLRFTLQRSPALELLMVRTEIIGLVGLALAILVLR